VKVTVTRKQEHHDHLINTFPRGKPNEDATRIILPRDAGWLPAVTPDSEPASESVFHFAVNADDAGETVQL
jgi:hypothetical protein